MLDYSEYSDWRLADLLSNIQKLQNLQPSMGAQDFDHFQASIDAIIVEQQYRKYIATKSEKDLSVTPGWIQLREHYRRKALASDTPSIIEKNEKRVSLISEELLSLHDERSLAFLRGIYEKLLLIEPRSHSDRHFWMTNLAQIVMQQIRNAEANHTTWEPSYILNAEINATQPEAHEWEEPQKIHGPQLAKYLKNYRAAKDHKVGYKWDDYTALREELESYPQLQHTPQLHYAPDVYVLVEITAILEKVV